ncbi:hypothetical protein EG328_004350 [Venturia inaequalis]|uniref:Uncharacterized protein n=1 Tax=Venturia inaequalis TaxID=5025 RepID=A0A8H3VFV1_VENIN|nr:hypothetical protein EG328_004350 [Venturia inaequalis]
MHFFTSIFPLLFLALTGVLSHLTAKDTIAKSDHPAFDTAIAQATENTYLGYFYNNESVWIKIHDSTTHAIISETVFKGNGKAVAYLLQSPHIKAAELSVHGPVGEALSKRACLAAAPAPLAKRAAGVFEPTTSLKAALARCFSTY